MKLVGRAAPWAVPALSVLPFIPALAAGPTAFGNEPALAAVSGAVSGGLWRALSAFPPGEVYGPLGSSACALWLRLAGGHLAAARLPSLLLHALNAALLYRLTLSLLLPASTSKKPAIRPRLWAAAGALLFALHPLRTETVARMSCHGTLLSGSFALLALLAFLRSRDGQAPRPRLWSCAAGAACVLAFMSEGTSWTVPLILLLLDLGRGGPCPAPEKPEEISPLWVQRIVFLLMAGTGFVFMLHGLELGRSVPDFPKAGPAICAGLAISSISHGLIHLVFPWGMHPLRVAGPGFSLLEPRVLLGAGILASALAAALRFRRRQPAFASLAAAYLILSLPSLYLSRPAGAVQMRTASDPWTYLPAMAASVAAAFALQGLARRLPRFSLLRLRGGLPVLVLLAVFGASTFLQSMRWRNERTLLEANLAAEPGCFECRAALARLASRQGDAAAREEHLRQGERLLGSILSSPAYGPADAGAVLSLATRLPAERRDEAVLIARRAAALDPENASLHFSMALWSSQAGLIDEAIAAGEAAVRLDPGWTVAHNNLGWYLQQKGRLQEAEKRYLAALAIDPADPLAANNLRAVRVMLGDECVVPGKLAERLNRGISHAQAGRLTEAIQDTKAVLRCDPKMASAHNNLGWFLQQAGRLKEAEEHYLAALRIDPASELSANNLRALMSLTGDECARPDRAMAHFIQGLELSRRGRREDAIRETRAALRCDPRLANAHNNLGWFLQEAGRNEEAIEHYQAAAKLNPQDSLSRNNLRALLNSLGRQ